MFLSASRIALARPRASLLSVLTRLRALSRERATLAQLDARALDDIGVSRGSAEKEAKRPAWDVPDHWHG